MDVYDNKNDKNLILKISSIHCSYVNSVVWFSDRSIVKFHDLILVLTEVECTYEQ